MTDQDHVREVKALEQMDLAGLRTRYRELFGEQPVTRNTKVLREQIQRRLLMLEIERKKKERALGLPAGGVETMDASATTQISRLQKMGLPELREAYKEAFGKPTKSRNRKQLFAQIARKLQAEPEDEKSKTAPAKPTLAARFQPKRTRQAKGAKAGTKGKKTESKKRQPKPIGARDPRLPKVGTTIERTYKGKKLLVRVLADGFEYEGKPYRSLSALAKHITGQIINGFAFFQLIPRQGKKS